MYVLYVLLCVYYERILAACLPRMRTKPTDTTSSATRPTHQSEAISAGLLAGRAPEPSMIDEHAPTSTARGAHCSVQLSDASIATSTHGHTAQIPGSSSVGALVGAR